MDRNLIDYLTPIMQEFIEMQKIMDVEQIEIELLWNKLKDTMSDQFIEIATIYSVIRWEKILNINPFATDTLDERKFRILATIIEQLPFTLRTLERQLENLCGKDAYYVELQNEIYTLIVRVALSAKSNFDDVATLLKRVAPANIVIDLSLKYNQNNILKDFTHDYLRQYTHNQLRNEVSI